MDFSDVEFTSRSAAHALLTMKEDLHRKLLNKSQKTYEIKIPKDSNLEYSVLQKDYINDSLIYKDTIRFDEIR